MYNKIKNKELTISELQKEFINLIKTNNFDDIEFEIIVLEAYLVHYYNNYNSTHYNRNKLFEKDDSTGGNKLLISSLTDKTSGHREFLGLLEHMQSGRRNGGDLDIGYLLKKIELTEAVKF